MNNKHWIKFCDFVCSIKSSWIKFISLILIFVPMFIGLAFICDRDPFSFNTFFGIMFAALGYTIAIVLLMIRTKRGIKD